MNAVGYNFDVLTPDQLRLGPDNRAFAYGDSLFETMIFRKGEVRFWDDHWERLTQGIEALYMEAPAGFTATRVHTFIQTLLQHNQLASKRARIRLRVVRKPGGLYTPTHRDIDFWVETAAAPTTPPLPKQHVALSETVQLMASPWSRFKTGNALPYVMVGLERARRGLDELLLLDHGGYLSECTMANLFWIIEEQLYTPSLDTGCIAGVMRRQVLQRARAQGWTIREGRFRPDELQKATHVFSTNASGVVPLLAFAGASYSAALPASLLPD
ncbi:branched-chain amino acid aminotransferase/4-amino-4-deoxychorismate lyase [Catalinimonas alkaloidigena]|uniref:branched-chain-amino-acid transaminase n=1 Tax=Catalinimonas alkaloidigena TaxID=1075417 RepID=A0A1G8XAG9_9BACT|nr:aminotransferase class IV [Catalinimonas alkaloidigena]SDJ87679.1 branched-chain amino acid aminotransferase/4-amino-4-deoxychorismate lyase [Catalinimonas alkaloidigena]